MLVRPEKIDEMYPNVGKDFAEVYHYSEKEDDLNILKEGKIVRIDEDSVMVDVQEKKEGRMDIREIKDSEGNLLFKVGDTILVHISKRGSLRVSHKKALQFQKTSEEIKALGDDYKDKIVEGVIIKKNKGGFVVSSASGVEYFMPRYYAGLKDDVKHEGKTIKACIIDVNPEICSITISRKKYLGIHSDIQKEHAKKLIESGLAYEGVVKSIQKFGVFVDVGCVEGLVHVTEISHKGPVSPFKIYKVGDIVQVKPVSFDEERNRLSLSIRALSEDPWKDIDNEIKVGYVIRVTVSNIESYGAFVDLGNDIEGFLHVSEMSWEKNIKEPRDYLNVGDEIDVEVIEIDPVNKKLRVSLKKLQDKPFDAFVKSHKVGDILKGKVATLTDFGMFVSVGEVDGLVHNEYAFWNKSKKCRDVFHEEDEVEVKIQKIDRVNEKISLNIRDLEQSPISKFAQKYKIGDDISGNVVSIKPFGVFISIDGEDVDGIIRNEDLGSNIDKENMKIGDKIDGVLVHIDKKANRIRVSVHKLLKKKEQQELREYNSYEKVVLGDVLGDLKEQLQNKDNQS